MKISQSTTKHTFISTRASYGKLFVRDHGKYITFGKISERNEPSITLTDREIMSSIKLLLKIRKMRKTP